MYEFDFWYAYFDSLFLKTIPLPHLSFIEIFDLHSLDKLTFPESKKLPQLGKCFQELQKFIFTQQNWVECECDQTVISEIQETVNLCVILIRIQKKYAQQFWHLKRRVQVSVCHFFALLLFFISSLIPGDRLQTINETKTSNKLCTSIKSLEHLVNRILPEINAIIKFLYHQGFSQEKKLTILFLQQIKQVLLNLPNVNKERFVHQFELAKYLYLIIPIELSRNQYKFRKTKRTKAATISNQMTEMRYYSDELGSNQSKNSWQDQYYEQKIRKFSLSKLNSNHKLQKEIYRTKVVKKKEVKHADEVNQLSCYENHPFLPKLFQFSQRVRKNSFYVSQKKVTKATLKTRQTMEIKFETQKSRKKTDFGKKSQSQSKQKQHKRTFSIQKQREKTNETIRSKKSSFYRIHKKTEVQQSQKLRPHKEKIIAKEMIKKQFSFQEIILKPYQENPHEEPSKKLNFFEGKPKGWGIIQDEFNKKKLLKDIQKLIHSNQCF